MKSHKLFIILFAIVLFSCEFKEDQIKSDWKYYSGFDFGDFLSFKNQDLRI